MSKRIAVISMALAGASLFAMASASAASRGADPSVEGYLGRGVGVAQRPRPAYDPIGANLGGFRLYPSLTTGVGYDDNVTAQDDGEVESPFVHVTPRIDIESKWSRHYLLFSAQSDNVVYTDEEDQSTYDLAGLIQGRLDVTSLTNLAGQLGYARLSEDRGSANTPGLAAEPVDYDRFDIGAGIAHQFNRLGVGAGVSYTDLDYDDVEAVGGGSLQQDDRDRNQTRAQAELSFEFSPGYEAFARGFYDVREYDLGTVAAVRDSDGYEINGGLRFEVTNLVTAEIFGGYLEQDYEALADVDGAAYGAAIEWFVTQLTTIVLQASRTVEDTTGLASGYLATDASIGIDHELLRNLILSAELGYGNNEYEGVNRDDDILDLSIGSRYLINRTAHLGLGYTFRTRDSNVVGADYDRNIFSVNLRLQM